MLDLKSPVFCNLDATGSVISHLYKSDKPVYYYALVVPGKEDEYGPMPIGEYFTDTHDVPSICSFLMRINHSMKKLKPAKKCFINKIETDFSLALIISCLWSFNQMSLPSYLKTAYDFLTNSIKEFPNITVVHVCSSHMIKTIKRKSFTHCQTKRQRDVALFFITQLIHCTNLEDFAIIVKKLIVVFGLQYYIPEFTDNFSSVSPNVESKDEDKQTDNDNDGDDKLLTDDHENVEDNSEIENGRAGSPFYKIGNAIRIEVLNVSKLYENKNRTENLKLNDFFCVKFLNYLLNFVLPYFPVWSASILKIFDILRDSNATVISYFNIVKHVIFQHKKHLPIPRFISHIEKLLHGWLLQRQYTVRTERQKKTR